MVVFCSAPSGSTTGGYFKYWTGTGLELYAVESLFDMSEMIIPSRLEWPKRVG